MPLSSNSFVFGHLKSGEPVQAITIDSGSGATATVIAYGATLQGLTFVDRKGIVADIVLGHDTIEPYEAHPTFLGVTVGRFANRASEH